MTVSVTIRPSAWPKFEAMTNLLDGVDVVGAMSRLWCWIFADDAKCPDGTVRGRRHTIRQVEAVARWKGVGGKFVEAMELVGFATRKNGKLVLLGADEYANAWRRRRENARRERARRLAAKKAAQKAIDDARSEPREKNTLDSLFELAKSRKVDVNRNAGTDEQGIPLSNHPLGFWTWMMRERARDITTGNGLDSPRTLIRRGVPVDSSPPDDFMMWYAERKAEGISDNALSDAWIRYLRDETFERKMWPLEIFQTEKVYRRRLTQSA